MERRKNHKVRSHKAKMKYLNYKGYTKIVFFFLAFFVSFLVGLFILSNRGLLGRWGNSLTSFWQKITAPKVNYGFKSAPGKSGFALLNENKAVGFNVLLASSANPKTPQARFEVDNDWIDFGLHPSIISNLIEAYKKERSGGGTNKEVITWKNAIPSSDISYQIKADGLKEEIILKDKNPAVAAVQNHELLTLPFNVTLNGVVPRKDLSGKLGGVFVDSKTGEYRFHIEKPYLADAKGARYDSVEFEMRPVEVAQVSSPGLSDLGYLSNLSKILNPVYAADSQPRKDSPYEARYVLVLKLPREWLADPNRAYPIILDPTITHNTQTAFATGTLNRVKDEGAADAAPLLTSSYHELAADINTVGLWHMNEASGTSVADSSGRGNTGTATGTTIVDGKFGKARSFTSPDVVEFSNTSTILNGDATIEAWIYRTGAVDVPAAIWRHGGLYEVFSADANANGSFNLGIRYYNGSAWNAVLSGQTINTGRWYHTAYVKSGSNRKVYLDGTLVIDTSYSPTTDVQNIKTGSAGGGTLIGIMDEVRISNVARTPEEIKQESQRFPYSVYTSPVVDLTQATSWTNLTWTGKGVRTGDGETPISTTGLVAQWNFNSTSGTTATADAGTCGASCNGTLTNFASTGSQDAAAGTGWTAANKRWGAGALMFDGSNDHVTFADSQSVKTVEAWIKPTAIASINLIQLTATATITTDANGKVTAGAGFTSPTVYVNGQSASPYLILGQWNHIAVTTDTTVTTATGYLGRVGTSYFNGVIDSTQLYSRALSAAEILANYQAGNIEFQTRTSADNSTWEAWKPVTNEAALDSLDSPSPISRISQTSLVSYWNLDETSGTRAKTAGTCTSCDLTDNATVTYAPGRLKNAGDFETSNSEYLSITDNADLSTGNVDFSLSAWVNLESKPAGGAAIIGKGNFDAGSEYILQYSGSLDRFHFESRNSADSGNQTVTANNLGSPSTEQWYFIVAWHDATADTMNIQVNNGAVDSASATGGVYDGTNTFNIGALSNAGRPWDGKIDEVAFWKRTLSAAERTQLFEDGLDLHGAGSGRIYRQADTTTKIEGTGSEKLQIGAPQVDANTVGLWHLEETSGTGAYIKDSTATNGTAFSATGGTITTSSGYTIHTFTSSGTFTPNGSGTVEYLVVGGGGGGGGAGGVGYGRGGGGGAGGFRTGSGFAVTAQAYSITVGAGGNGSTGTGGNSTQGGSSVFSTITSTGGGYGTDVMSAIPPGTGGSGGGAGGGNNTANDNGAAGNTPPTSPSQGNNGGNSTINNNRVAGGGGGASAVGGNFSGYVAGSGGAGTASSISGASVTYAGGGGGGGGDALGQTAGSGGAGGGGAGSGTTNGTAGTANTGGGGGGSGYNASVNTSGGNGGSGIVIIRYYTGNHGTPTGTSVVDGFYGKARSFNGTSDYISTGTIGLPTTNATWSFWMKPITIVPNAGIYNTGIADGDHSFRIYVGATTITAGVGWDQDDSYTSGDLTNKWSHVAVTKSGSSYNLYLNGASVKTWTNNFSFVNTGSSLGRFNGGAGWIYGYNGLLDEFKIDNVARSAEEIAEAHRAGRDHRVGRTITSTDLSAKTKLPFYVAADRPGTYLEATVGESAFANYEPDSSTVGLWHLEEQTGSGAYIKDSSGRGNNGTPTGTTFVQGKIGKARSFNGTSDYVTASTTNYPTGTSAMTIDGWFNTNSFSHRQALFSYGNNTGLQTWDILIGSASDASHPAQKISMSNLNEVLDCGAMPTLQTNTWYHFAATKTGANTYTCYLNGQLTFSGTLGSSTSLVNSSAYIGRRHPDTTQTFSGSIDEIRVSNIVRTADDIRQAYEVGKRTHPITIDFVSKPQAAYSTGTSVTINNPWGTTNLTDTLKVGDTLIFKENVGGTETVSSSNVSNISNTSNTYGTVTLASAPTFPTGGYTTNATVFKWQREYFDLTGSLSGHRDATTRLTLRVTDGSQGANVWLDDFRSNTNYINDNTPDSFDTATGIGTYSNTSIPSTLNRYFQYRALLSSWDTPVSPQLTSASLTWTTNASPVAPTISAPSNGATQVSLTPAISFAATDPDSDYLRYKLQIATDVSFSQNLQTFDQTASQTGWSGQNAQTSTAYTSGSTATYTLQSALAGATTYYLRAYAVDPAGSNVWGSASSTVSFTTNSSPGAPTISSPANAATNVSLTPTIQLAATDTALDWLRYKIQLCTDSGFTLNCQTFDETSSQTGWTGQNTQTSTAYLSGTTASYTLQSALTVQNGTYYIRAYAKDPGGANIWSSASATVSFTTTGIPGAPNAVSPANDTYRALDEYTDTSKINSAQDVQFTPEDKAILKQQY